MRIWFDTEFMEDGHTIELLSIGMVREDGTEYYAEAAWADLSRANDWVRLNVIPHLRGGDTLRTNAQMRREIIEFVEPSPMTATTTPEFWAWFASYDWVVLCQLFGRMVDLPLSWPQRVNDVAQVAHMVGANKLPQQTTVEHHALADARHCRALHLWLEQMYSRVLP